MKPCDECKYRHVHSSSVVWCHNCDETLCKDCKDFHKFRKSTRNHQLIDKEEYLKAKPVVLSGCNEHHEPYEFYCMEHDLPICSKCTLSKHKTCGEIQPLDSVLDSSSSELLTKLDDKLDALSYNLNRAFVNVTSSRRMFREKMKTLKMELKTGIENALDLIERECIQEFYAYDSRFNKNLDYIESECETVDNVRVKYHKLLSRKHSLALFLELKEVEKDIDAQDKIFQQMVLDHKMNDMRINLSFDPTALQNVIFNIEMITPELPFIIPGSQGAQTSLGIQKHKVKEFDLHSADRKTEFRGCAIISDSLVCFADKNSKKLLFMSTLGLQKEFVLEDKPVDIATLKDFKLAVSLFESKSIQILNTQFWQWEKFHFSDKTGLGGLTVFDDRIAVRVSGQGYYLITLDSQLDLAIEKKGTKMHYVACSNNRIYGTKWDTHEVFCLDMAGKLMWSFKDRRKLKNPNGVAIDTNERVYVAGTQSNNVVVISSDGIRCTEIISSCDNIKKPTSVDYDKKNNLLLVCSANRTSVLFSIK